MKKQKRKASVNIVSQRKSRKKIEDTEVVHRVLRNWKENCRKIKKRKRIKRIRNWRRREKNKRSFKHYILSLKIKKKMMMIFKKVMTRERK